MIRRDLSVSALHRSLRSNRSLHQLARPQARVAPGLQAIMPPVVRTRRVAAVPLPAGAVAAPGRRVPLSPFDARWVMLPPVSHVFLFQAPCPPIPFRDVAASLRSALAVVLPAFHPFAGELVCSPGPRAAVSIVCAEDAHVAFVEAETDLDFAGLVDQGADLGADAFRQLAPDIRREELPAPVMAVQVTEFVGGGIAVGVAMHHAAADGSGFWRFLDMWAAAAALGHAAAGHSPPLHDRSLVRFDGDEELAGEFLRQVTPELPRLSYVPKVAVNQGSSPECRPLLRRQTFTFTASAMQHLKQRVTTAGAGAAAPSTFCVLAAHGWVSMARAKGLADDGGPMFAVFLADCRAHMSPRVPDTYAGNCVATCVVALGGAELAAPDGAVRACSAIADAIAEVKRDPLARARWVSMFKAVPPGRAVVLVGSTRLPAFTVDFGFGRPARSEHASMNHDGEIVFLAGMEAGSVQATVAVTTDKMPAFRDIFTVDA